MQRLGMLEGEGLLEVNGETVGAVEYVVNIWLDGETKKGDGSLGGDSKVLAAGFEIGVARIVRSGGQALDINIVAMNGSVAELKVTGPIPDFR